MKKILITIFAIIMCFSVTSVFSDDTNNEDLKGIFTEYLQHQEDIEFFDFFIDGEKQAYKNEKQEEIKGIIINEQYYIPLNFILSLPNVTSQETSVYEVDKALKINIPEEYREKTAVAKPTGEYEKQAEITRYLGRLLLGENYQAGNIFALYKGEFYIESSMLGYAFSNIKYPEKKKQAYINSEVAVLFNDKEINIEDSGVELSVIELEDSQLLLPIRSVANIAGKEISWDAKTKTIKLFGNIEPQIFYKNENEQKTSQPKFEEVVYRTDVEIEVDGKTIPQLSQYFINYNGNYYVYVAQLDSLDLFITAYEPYVENNTGRTVTIYKNSSTSYERELYNKIQADLGLMLGFNYYEIEKGIKDIKSMKPPKEFVHTDILNKELDKMLVIAKNLENAKDEEYEKYYEEYIQVLYSLIRISKYSYKTPEEMEIILQEPITKF